MFSKQIQGSLPFFAGLVSEWQQVSESTPEKKKKTNGKRVIWVIQLIEEILLLSAKIQAIQRDDTIHFSVFKPIESYGSPIQMSKQINSSFWCVI